jgi:hypothetical protein
VRRYSLSGWSRQRNPPHPLAVADSAASIDSSETVSSAYRVTGGQSHLRSACASSDNSVTGLLTGRLDNQSCTVGGGMPTLRCTTRLANGRQDSRHWGLQRPRLESENLPPNAEAKNVWSCNFVMLN